jgi:hypothetical protein
MFIVPNTEFRYLLFGNVSPINPCTLFAGSQLQIFSYPFIQEWREGRADDWGRLGRELLPRQLLVAPGPGTFFNPAYAVASGTVSLPPAVDPATVLITIYQNSFALVGGVAQKQSIALGSTNVLVTAGGCVNWELVVGAQTSLTGGPGFSQQAQLSIGVVLYYPTTSTPEVQLTQFEFQS